MGNVNFCRGVSVCEADILAGRMAGLAEKEAVGEIGTEFEIVEARGGGRQWMCKQKPTEARYIEPN